MELNNIINYFIPEKYKQDKELDRKSRFIVWLVFILILITAFFGFITTAQNPENISTTLMAIVILPLFFSALLHFRKKGSFNFTTHVICGILILSFGFVPDDTGGLFSPDMPGLYILPILALIMGNYRIGLFYGVLALGIFLGYYIIDSWDSSRHLKQLSILSPEYYFFNLSLTFLVILFLVFRNENLRQKFLRELKETNLIILEKRKEITDSINYAKRIQEAILPPSTLIENKLPNTFVLYKPKDIVAGDFYWMEEINDCLLIAAADCTGHGVPGAMVSVVCSNALNRAVKEFHLSDTGVILDKVTDLVLETFEKSVSEVKDGMDISLLSINKLNKKIQWSGANNPLWYFEHEVLNEITADKQPIGKSDHRKPFTTHLVEYKSDTTFYLFTDGYADQFGGPKGKKFKYKQLMELLSKNHKKEPLEQQTILNTAFANWKGDLEQVDDVCIIGIKL